MGLFSADCQGCGHPLLMIDATNGINYWMGEGVAITPEGNIIHGDYDGYGRLIDDEGDEHNVVIYDEATYDRITNTIWHGPCWRAAGSPTDYRGGSLYSADQGWFFNEGDHDMAEPEL